MGKEKVYLQIEGELRVKTAHNFVGAGGCPVQDEVVEYNSHLQDSFGVLIRNVGNGA